MALSLGELYIQIGANTDALTAAVPAFNRLEKAINKLTDSVDKMNSNISSSYESMSSNAEKTSKRTTSAFSRMKSSIDKTTGFATSAFTGLYKSIRGLVGVVINLKTALLGLAAAYGIKQIVDTSAAFDGLKAGMLAVTGSTQNAAKEFAFIKRQSQRLGVDIEGLAKQYIELSSATQGTSLEGDKTKEIFLSIAEAGRVLQLSNEKIKDTFMAVQQIVSKGTVQAEEVRRQLGNSIPGAFRLMANAYAKSMGMIGATTEEKMAALEKAMKKGVVKSTDILQLFASEIRKNYGGGLEAALTKARAVFTRFTNEFTLLRKAIGDAGLLDFVKGLTRELTNYVKPFRQILEKIGPDLKKATEDLKKSFGIGDTKDYFDTVKNGFADVVEAFSHLPTVVNSTFGDSLKVLGIFADGLQGIHIIFKGLEIAAVAFKGAFALAMATSLKVVKTFANYWNAYVADPIDKAVKYFGGQGLDLKIKVDANLDPLYKSAKDSFGEVKKLKGELNDLLMEKLPSQSINDLVKSLGVSKETASKIKNLADKIRGLVKPIDDAAKSADDYAKTNENAGKSTETFWDKILTTINKVKKGWSEFSSAVGTIDGQLNDIFSRLFDQYSQMASYQAQMARDALDYGNNQIQMYTSLADSVRYTNTDLAKSYDERAVAASQAAAKEYQARQKLRDQANAQAKKAFENQKKLQMAETVMSTANAVAGTLAHSADLTPPVAIALAGVMSALGAVQLATIQQQQYTPRQRGGSIVGGKPYLVGEAGPELIVPNSGGTVIPNNKLQQAGGGGQGATVNFNITANDTTGFDNLLAARRGMITNMIRNAYDESMRRTPF